MPSNNSKYSEEMREQTAKLIVESGKSATSMAEEPGIDTNTVCRWVRDYRRANNLPTYAEAKGIKTSTPKSERELILANKELERQLKKKQKELLEEKEKVEILKKSLHIFMQAPD
ncbi:MAG: transposase [Lachnospiraceae bacterium]|nr:transposase [Lachnospiraceae bacterium]